MTARYVRAASVLWRRTADRVILLVPPSDELFSLSGTGCSLWDCLSEPTTITAIASELAQQYAVSSEQAEADIAPVLSELVERGAVTRAGS